MTMMMTLEDKTDIFKHDGTGWACETISFIDHFVFSFTLTVPQDLMGGLKWNNDPNFIDRD